MFAILMEDGTWIERRELTGIKPLTGKLFLELKYYGNRSIRGHVRNIPQNCSILPPIKFLHTSSPLGDYFFSTEAARCRSLRWTVFS